MFYFNRWFYYRNVSTLTFHRLSSTQPELKKRIVRPINTSSIRLNIWLATFRRIGFYKYVSLSRNTRTDYIYRRYIFLAERKDYLATLFRRRIVAPRYVLLQATNNEQSLCNYSINCESIVYKLWRKKLGLKIKLCITLFLSFNLILIKYMTKYW